MFFCELWILLNNDREHYRKGCPYNGQSNLCSGGEVREPLMLRAHIAKMRDMQNHPCNGLSQLLTPHMPSVHKGT